MANIEAPIPHERVEYLEFTTATDATPSIDSLKLSGSLFTSGGSLFFIGSAGTIVGLAAP